MGLYERVKDVAKERHISINKLEKELGFARSSISKFNTNVPGYEKLQQIADYFDVSLEYLTTGKEKEWEPTFTEKDERDIKKKLDNLMNQLESDTGLMYDGEPVDDETQELLKGALEIMAKTAALKSKKKFTPNKYKK